MTETLDPLGGPLRHLRRTAPPWSRRAVTVCGRPLDDVKLWLPFEEAKTLVNKVGRRRADLLFCQTCLANHSYRAGDQLLWEKEPAQVVKDWAEKATWRRNADSELIVAEIRALALLVETHRAEFDLLVVGVQADELAERRRRGRRP